MAIEMPDVIISYRGMKLVIYNQPVLLGGALQQL